MMVAVDFHQNFRRHTEIASRLEGIDASLHQPRRSRVAADVRSVRNVPRAILLLSGLTGSDRDSVKAD